ncbi:MAG: hypothetical protein AAF735_01040 [Myxococcota bacterium]
MRGLATEEHTEGEDRFVLANPGLGILATQVSGRAHLGQVHALIAYQQRVLEQHPSGMWVFHNWAEAQSYAKGVREELVEWTNAHMDSIFRVHLVFRSRLIAMGVSVAMIGMKRIQVMSSVEELEAELAEAVRVRSP